MGQLWYLNVHASPPYRWQRCQALLYPHALLLSWLAPGGGRGIVALDLLNCTSVQSAPSPMHPIAHDDVGTIAARQQSNDPNGLPLMEMLVPFHMMYADGVERLAAESILERQKWVNRIWCVSFTSRVLIIEFYNYSGRLLIGQLLFPIRCLLPGRPRPLSALLKVTPATRAMVLVQPFSYRLLVPSLTSLISNRRLASPVGPLSSRLIIVVPSTTPSSRIRSMFTQVIGVSLLQAEIVP